MGNGRQHGRARAAPPHCKATGFFRLEAGESVVALVTPEGNAFLSFGINHVQPDRTAAPYNREFWPKGYTSGMPRRPPSTSAFWVKPKGGSRTTRI